MRSYLILFFILVPAFAQAADIPMVGLDENGNPTEVIISGHDYTEQVQAMVTTVNDSALPALDAQKTSNAWLLRTIVVGVGFGFEAGVGPLIKVKASPRFRLAFSNSTDAVLP